MLVDGFDQIPDSHNFELSLKYLLKSNLPIDTFHMHQLRCCKSCVTKGH